MLKGASKLGLPQQYCFLQDAVLAQRVIKAHKQTLKTHTYQDVKHKSDGPGRRHAQHRLPPVPLAVDEHQAHILEVAHGPREELHQGVGQPVTGQHFNSILLDCGYAPVEGLAERSQRG